MNGLKMRRPSPALVIATVALFIALGGSAGAVVTAAVPLAKRALVADNAKKVGGQTPAEIAAAAATRPGPASTAAGLVTIKTAAGRSLPMAAATSWSRATLVRRPSVEAGTIPAAGRTGGTTAPRPTAPAGACT